MIGQHVVDVVMVDGRSVQSSAGELGPVSQLPSAAGNSAVPAAHYHPGVDHVILSRVLHDGTVLRGPR